MRRPGAEAGGRRRAPTSAWWFDGWQDASRKLGLDPPEVRTVADAESWLLRVGWQRAKAGRLAIDEIHADGYRGTSTRTRSCDE